MERYTSPDEPSPPCQDAKDKQVSRETILQRRNRVLGKTSVKGVDRAPRAASSSGDKRRGQVLQAQRVHRQRTIEYITDLENEVLRLRETEAALISTIREKEYQLEKLRRDVGTPVMNENWVGNTDWNENAWNFPFETIDNFQYARVNSLGIYNQALVDGQDAIEYQDF